MRPIEKEDDGLCSGGGTVGSESLFVDDATDVFDLGEDWLALGWLEDEDGPHADREDGDGVRVAVDIFGVSFWKFGSIG